MCIQAHAIFQHFAKTVSKYKQFYQGHVELGVAVLQEMKLLIFFEPSLS